MSVDRKDKATDNILNVLVLEESKKFVNKNPNTKQNKIKTRLIQVLIL
jgi:hypothetical protein